MPQGKGINRARQSEPHSDNLHRVSLVEFDEHRETARKQGGSGQRPDPAGPCMLQLGMEAG